MISFFKFLSALPAFFRFFKLIEARLKELQIQSKVSSEVQTIHEAFDAKDPTKLNHLFSSD